MNKEIVIVSFSGGRTSAFLYWLLAIKNKDKYHVIPVFMNTGREDPKTYEYIKRCNDYWDMGIVCLNPVVHHGKRKGSTYEIVDIDTLKYDKTIAEEVVKKYGLFGIGFMHCTREMKVNPFENWKKDHYPKTRVAIGIRADEVDRMSADMKKKRIFYPLVKEEVTKKDILQFWSTMPFDLEIEEHLGNCIGCYKKSNKKLKKVIKERRYAIDDLVELEKLDPKKKVKMFRGNLNPSELLEANIDDSEVSNGCSESCEVY